MRVYLQQFENVESFERFVVRSPGILESAEHVVKDMMKSEIGKSDELADHASDRAGFLVRVLPAAWMARLKSKKSTGFVR